jgi:hypothetical protein
MFHLGHVDAIIVPMRADPFNPGNHFLEINGRISSPWIWNRPVSMAVERRSRQSTEASLETSSCSVAERG